jgi:hypothetical protein
MIEREGKFGCVEVNIKISVLKVQGWTRESQVAERDAYYVGESKKKRPKSTMPFVRDGIVRERAAAAIVCWYMYAALAVCCFFGRPANSLILILF